MTSTTLASRIDGLLEETGMKPADLARHLKVAPASVANWRNGRTKVLRGDVLLKAAELFNVEAQWLQYGITPKRTATNETFINQNFKAQEASPPQYISWGKKACDLIDSLPPRLQPKAFKFLQLCVISLEELTDEDIKHLPKKAA